MLQNLLTVEANEVGSQKKWIKREGTKHRKMGRKERGGGSGE